VDVDAIWGPKDVPTQRDIMRRPLDRVATPFSTHLES
jgi:hypothetical protein